MIYRISSNLTTFKTLEFNKGLNVLIAKKEQGSNDRQTRNRAGKTSLLEIIHFLTGSEAGKDSLFRTEPLIDKTFTLEFDLASEKRTVKRSGNLKSKVFIDDGNSRKTLRNTEWIDLLGSQLFQLEEHQEKGRTPKFRSLFSYFVRRQLAGGLTTPEKQATMQQPGDYQLSLMYLLGLDWRIARDWQMVRDREKTLRELRAAAGTGALGSIIGKAADLRTQLTVAENQLKDLRKLIESYQVLPQYKELEQEADKLTQRLGDIANNNVIDTASLRDLELALKSEAPPQLTELERIYAEIGITLPSIAIKRYEEVANFHQSVIRNRREYLSSELESTQQRIKDRENERAALDLRRAEIMRLLESHGALEQFSLLQAEVDKKQTEVESLRQRFQSAEQLEGKKTEFEIERNHLTLRLRRDFTEQRDNLDKAIIAFEKTSNRLYESAGSMVVEETSNGPSFSFPMQGSRSKGIKNMQIFCFDMMLMQICAERKIGPGFLVHDSHLFDGVDGRQVIHALKTGAELANEFGFQYIVTMNEDDAFKESITGFNLSDYVISTVLTDSTEDGGLFGIRF